MGWVKFIKFNEDNEWVIYNYSHDCEEYDGIVKIKKDKKFSESNIIIKPSRSDSSNCHFAYCVASRVYKWIKDDQELLDYFMLAYG